MKLRNSANKNTRATVRRVMTLLGKHRTLLVLSLLCAAISSLLTLAVPLLVGDAIDAMIETEKVA